MLLWQLYEQRGDARALETLLAYNIQDAVNLELLMVHAWNANLERLTAAPFAAGYRLNPSTLPANPFAVDLDTIRHVKSRYPTVPRRS